MSPGIERVAAALSERYRIERELGRGGMATVWLAEDLKHGRLVAIKVLHPHLAAVVGAERFLKEIRTTANLQHPHILPLFDSGEADGLLYYVMPYVTGETLRQAITRDKQLPIADAIRITSEIAAALDHAHRQGVLHRDIKPENILLHDGQAVVADFGIALATEDTDTSRLTETGLSIGTPSYMSPEQALGERTLGPRTDVYAMGAVLYEMLTGAPPFTGASSQAVVAKVIAERPMRPSRRRREIPKGLDDAVLTALEKRPDDRFETAAGMRAAVLGESGGGRHRRRFRMGALGAAGLIAALGAIALLAVRPWRVRPMHVPDAALADLVKNANHLVAQRTLDGCKAGIKMLSQATESDSLYAESFAGLAKADALCAVFGSGDPDVYYTNAKFPAEHALLLDPRVSDSHTTLGMVHLFHDQEFAAARDEFIKAIALDSTKYEPWLFRAWTYMADDQVDSAVYSVEQAKRLRPAGDDIVGVRLATTLRYRGDFDAARRELDEVKQVNPRSSLASGEEFELDVQQHRCDAAAAVDVTRLPSINIQQYDDGIHAAFDVFCGRRYLAQRYVDSVAKAEQAGGYVDHFGVSLAYAALGDTSNVLAALRQAVQQHSTLIFFMHRHFLLQPYSNLPAFRAIMADAHVK